MDSMARPPVSLHALAAARRETPADLLIRGGRVFSPLTREWVRTDLAIADGCVVGWGSGDATEVIDVDGAALVAGFIDAHMHLESSKLWVDEFVRAVLPCGTTAVACDPHEIANVCGLPGIGALVEAASSLPFTFGVAASSCVPASHFETSGASFTAADVRTLVNELGAIGIAEVMNFPAVINGDPEMREIIAAAGWRSVDGHAPGLLGSLLDAYIAAGVESDHECSSLAEAHEKRQKGMWVFLRQGSASQDLLTLLPTVMQHGALATAFCTDDREPDLISAHGHVNHCIRLAVEAGLDEMDALLMATWLPARFHHFEALGALSPGHQADVVVFDQLEGFHPSMVLQAGRVVARDGVVVDGAVAASSPPDWMRTTMHLDVAPPATSLDIGISSGAVRAITVSPTTLRTTESVVDVADPGVDLARLAVVERHQRSGRIGLGFVQGYGLTAGAIASTVAHDAHNLMLVGARDASGPTDMAVAAARVCELGGGQVVVRNGQVLAELALPIAGLMSDRPLDIIAIDLEALERAAASIGVVLPAPFMTLSFLGLSVIGDLRITDRGLVDVRSFSLVPVPV
jgi:adenine deaminase